MKTDNYQIITTKTWGEKKKRWHPVHLALAQSTPLTTQLLCQGLYKIRWDKTDCNVHYCLSFYSCCCFSRLNSLDERDFNVYYCLTYFYCCFSRMNSLDKADFNVHYCLAFYFYCHLCRLNSLDEAGVKKLKDKIEVNWIRHLLTLHLHLHLPALVNWMQQSGRSGHSHSTALRKVAAIDFLHVTTTTTTH